MNEIGLRFSKASVEGSFYFLTFGQQIYLVIFYFILLDGPMFLLESLLSSANWRSRLLTRHEGTVSRTSAPCVQRQVLIALSENIRRLCHLCLSSSLAKR